MADDDTIERVAKALYAIEWGEGSSNLRDGHWSYETPDAREYWLRSARAAIAAYEATE
jgi:hypothetical protein